jgi:hypothetical protein
MTRHRPFVAAIVLAASSLLPAQSGIPTPESVLGFAPGSDYKLANYDQVIDYFKKVDAASDRVRMFEAGKSTQGRTFYFVLVSSKRNLDRLDRYREIARQLAHPAGLTDATARQLAQEGKAFVHIDGGLHSTEVAGPQHTPLLLHELVSRAGDPEIAAMLDEVIVMLWPTINPDGHQMVADAYAKRTNPTAGSAPLPGLYQEFVGHDNNRDAYMLNMIESRVVEHTWRQWEPSIIYVHHQSAPFPTRIWLPPFAEPIATHAPYVISRELNMIGMAIAQRLDQEGKVGATHMGTGYDAWYPGYIDYAPVFKNIPAFWTETQGNGAAPTDSPADRVPANMQRPQALYASPWMGGKWTLRDAVEYMKTASLATIEYAAKYKTALLYNRYQSGRDQIARGRSSAPYGYVVPQAQRDPVAAVELLRRLAFGGVRVTQLTAPADLEGETFPAGTWIVPNDQEFAALAREVLDVQKYPEIRDSPGGPLDTPYDAAGWTLPMSMGVRVVSLSQPLPAATRSAMRTIDRASSAIRLSPYDPLAGGDAAAFDSAPGLGFDSDPVARAIVPPPGTLTGNGAALAVNPAENNAFRAVNRALKSGGAVAFSRGATPADARYVITGLAPAAQQELVNALALRAERTTAAATSRTPRIGLYDNPTGMDHGWTRWVLEQYGFEYVRVTAADLQAGGLRDRLDALLVTDDANILGGGGRGGRGGPPAPAGANVPPAGRGEAPAPPPAIDPRVRAIDEFVRRGGTLVCFNRASTFAIDQLKLPVRNVVAGLNRTQFFVGGSLLKVTTNPAHQVMAGMPADAAVFYDSGPVFEPTAGFTGALIASYPSEGTALLSGFLQGESHLQGKAAAVDVHHGDGHVVLLGFRPQWRGQPFGTFRVIFNALLLGN